MQIICNSSLRVHCLHLFFCLLSFFSAHCWQFCKAAWTLSLDSIRSLAPLDHLSTSGHLLILIWSQILAISHIKQIRMCGSPYESLVCMLLSVSNQSLNIFQRSEAVPWQIQILISLAGLIWVLFCGEMIKTCASRRSAAVSQSDWSLWFFQVLRVIIHIRRSADGLWTCRLKLYTSHAVPSADLSVILGSIWKPIYWQNILQPWSLMDNGGFRLFVLLYVSVLPARENCTDINNQNEVDK